MYSRGRLRASVFVSTSVLLVCSAWSENTIGTEFDALAPDSSIEEPEPFDCGYRPTQLWLEDVQAAVSRWEIPNPAARVIPSVRQPQSLVGFPTLPCLSRPHIFSFEDTNQLLITDYSNGSLVALMADAANALIATHGDIYDFIGLWLNFAPHHVLGTAAYVALENDVTGIGTELFNQRAALGLNGENLEGMVITWNINFNSWQPGTGAEAQLTRIALSHELEHRFGVYLPDLVDGRQMQGYGGFGCYTLGHWNPAVDSQGSTMGVGEWTGTNPATLASFYPNFHLFNTDTGRMWSYTDLYLMGYVSPAEMDAGNSELRYMDNWNCMSTDYFSSISTFTSTDIIATAGPRVPDFMAEDKHYRMGWIMIHQPGDTPTQAELTKAVAIHAQQQIDWKLGTLGLGTLDASLFNDLNCNNLPDDIDIALGNSDDVNTDGIPDESQLPPGVVLPEITVELASPTELRIQWLGVECPGGFTDYAIYEGQIGSWYSHEMIDCSDDSANRNELVQFGPGDTYYLVVPHNIGGEGSYGTDSFDVERSPAPISCAGAVNLATCP
jgi:hypothetical protein